MSEKIFKDQLKIKAWEHIDNSETGDLTGFGSHTDPKTGNTYRIRVNKLNREKKTGLKIVTTESIKDEGARREAAKTYGSEESKKASKAVKYKDTDLAQKANEFGEIPLYDEHQTGLQTGVEMPKGIGTDDLANRYTRPDKEFDVFKVKNAKDDFDDFAKKQGNPWTAFVNEKTDELQVVNMEEWINKDDGRYVDIFQDGVTLDRKEVSLWKKAVRTGKLGNFPLRKAAYLLKELNKNPGMKLLKGTALVGIPALLDAVVAADAFAQLEQEEITKRDKLLAELQAISGVSGLASLTPAAPVAIPTSIATGALHTLATTVDSQKIKKQQELMLSLGIEQLPNGTLLDSAQNVVQYDYEKGEIITPQIGQGHVKKLTRRGSR